MIFLYSWGDVAIFKRIDLRSLSTGFFKNFFSNILRVSLAASFFAASYFVLSPFLPSKFISKSSHFDPALHTVFLSRKIDYVSNVLFKSGELSKLNMKIKTAASGLEGLASDLKSGAIDLNFGLFFGGKINLDSIERQKTAAKKSIELLDSVLEMNKEKTALEGEISGLLSKYKNVSLILDYAVFSYPEGGFDRKIFFKENGNGVFDAGDEMLVSINDPAFSYSFDWGAQEIANEIFRNFETH